MTRSLYRRKIIRQRGSGWGSVAAQIGTAVRRQQSSGRYRCLNPSCHEEPTRKNKDSGQSRETGG